MENNKNSIDLNKPYRTLLMGETILPGDIWKNPHTGNYMLVSNNTLDLRKIKE